MQVRIMGLLSADSVALMRYSERIGQAEGETWIGSAWNQHCVLDGSRGNLEPAI